MNKTYRLIWNRRLGAWVATAETTRASGKKSSGRARAGVAAAGFAAALGASLPLAAAADLAPGALPTGGTVAAGQADIAASGTRMDITQSSQKAIINWQGFDIGSQAQVNFAQPNAAAVALNRVSGPNISRIEGQLTASGQVFLVNLSGVIFGNGARVNAGAFVASTLNIRDDDFLAGNYTFTGTGGTIENRGTISAAPGGYVAFIAPKITNAGIVSAPQGTVAMGAGERVTLNFAGDRLVGLSVAAETLDTLIENRQAIRAEGGAILLTAAGAEAVTRGVINNSGALEAGSLTADGGRIVLTAGNDVNLASTSTVAVDGQKGGEITVQAKAGTLLTDGSLSARGASGTGGTVKLLGNQVGLVNAAQVDSSGTTGGGTVLVGGDYQGGNAEVANARATYVAPDVTIKANALQQGDGGKVIVWANEIARFYGNISADGAGTGGNGGFVETSGKAVLDASGSVSALGAGGGRAGSWLLDPYDITIQTLGSNANVTASPNFTSNGNSAIVTTGSIQTALNAGTSVTVTTGAGGAQAGNITVANAIGKSAGGNASLTLTAINNIVFNAGANISASAGQLALTLNAGGTITNPATINTNGGLLTYNATGAATQSGVISGAGGLTKNGTGTLTLSGANTYTGTTTISAGTLVAANATALGTTAGGTTIAPNATLDINGVAIGAEAVNVQGTGVGGNGAITGTGTGSLSGAVTLTGNTTVGGSGTLTLSGVIADGGGNNYALTKTGSGTLILSSANTYGTGTNVNQGVLSLRNNSAAGNAGTVTVANGAAVELQGGVTLARALNLNGTGVGGNGALRSISGNNTWSGAVTLSGASEIQSDAGTLTVSGALNNAGFLATYDANTGSITDSGVISGAGGLTKTGAGTLTLGTANSYTGATNINAGTLALNAAGTIAASSGVANNGTFTVAAPKTIDSMTGTGNTVLGGTLTIGDASNTSSAYGGVISGTGGITKAGTGTLTLSGANTYTGVTTISAGTLSANSIGNVGGGASALGAPTTAANGTIALAGGATLQYTGAGSSSNRIINLTSSGGIVDASGSGALTLSGGVTGNARNLTLTGTGVGTENGTIATTSGTVTKAGTGTWTLSGANTYTGATAINAGTLVASNAAALGTTAGGTTVAAGATLNINNVAIGAEAVTLNGTLRGTGAGASLAGTVALNAAGAAIDTATATDALTLSGVVSGANALTKTGAGTLTLGGVNTYTGATNINAGTLALNAAGTIAASSGVANNGAFTIAASKTIDSMTGTGNTVLGGTLTIGDASNTSSAYGGVISGAGGITKAGTGTLTLSGANTYTGVTTINAGTLQANGGNAIGDSSSVTAASGATLALGASETIGSLAGAGNVTLGANTLTAGGNGTNTTFSGVMSGTGGLTKAGVSQMTLSGANTYTGATTISSGSLALSGGAAISDTSAVNLSAAGANLTLNASETIGSLAGVASTSVILNANTLTMGGNNGTTAYAGNIGGTGNLVKNGTGSTTLSGNNNYAGLTTVNAGTLAVTANNALGSNAAGTTVNAGATLDLQNVAYSTAELVTLNGGTLAVSTGNSSLAGPVNLTAASFVNVDNPSQLTLSGAVTAPVNLDVNGGGSLTAVNAANNFSTVSITSGNNISLRDANAINLGASTVSGALTVTSSGNISQSGSLNVAGLTTLAAGGGNVTLNNGSNNFGTVAASGVNVALADSNAIDLGTTNAAANLTVSANGAITQSGVLTVAGASTFLANANPITLNNASNDFGGEVSLTNSGSTNNVQIRDVNDLTLGTSSIGGTLTAIAGGTLTLSSFGTGVSAGGSGDAITLVGSRFVNLKGASAMSAPGGRWLVWSSNPSPFSGATPDNRGGLAYDFKQYNATYGVTPVQGTGNGFLYALAPTITPGLTGTVSKVYDTTTTAPLTAANFTPATGVDGDVITMTGTGAYDNPNVAGSPTKLVTASGIAATVTSSVADGSKPVYGYTLTSTTASANIGEITPAPLTITGNTTTSQYTANAQTNGYTVSGLLAGNGDSVTGVSTLATGTNVGTYADNLTSATGTGLANYTIGYVNGSLQITPAPLINPTLPREAVNQQAIAAQYTDPAMSTEALVGPYYVFDDDREGKDGMPPASAVRIVGSGIRLPN